MRSIIIKRENNNLYLLRKYSILVNGKKIGLIANNETKHIEVEDNKALLQIKIDWLYSNKIDLELETNNVFTIITEQHDFNTISLASFIVFLLTLALSFLCFYFFKINGPFLLIFIAPFVISLVYQFCIAKKFLIAIKPSS